MDMVNSCTFFMLPTQSANAFVIDVAPLLILGALIVLYYVFKNRNKTTSKEFSKNKADNSNTNILKEKELNNNGSTLFTLKRTKNSIITSTDSNITKNEEVEDIPIQKEKEKVILFNEL